MKPDLRVSDGTRNFCLSSSKRLKGEYRKIVFACLNKNAVFAHLENLVAMLTDKRQEVRRRVLDLISYSCEPEKERNFVFPRVNPNAQVYTKLINLENELPTPPLLKGTANLANIEQVPFRFEGISCHSEAVEWMVAVVTQAAELKTGYHSRHRTILNCIKP